jgi:hypothetical protein
MFPGSPRKRDGVRVIPLGAVSQIALCGDDPDFIVLEVFNTAFSGTTITLPNDAPIGKMFKFAVTTEAFADPALTVEWVDILVPLSKGIDTSNVWRVFSGQRPTFTYSAKGWVADGGSTLSISGASTVQDIAIGSYANSSANGVAIGRTATGYSSGVAIGAVSSGYSSGVAIGVTSSGYSSGVSIGRATNGSINGVAVGYSSVGNANGVAVGYASVGNANGVAVGFQASTNNKDKAVAIGYYSKAQRYREFVKSADGAATTLQSFSILDWYGDTTNATQTEIFLGAANERALVLASSAYMFKLLAVARDNVNNVVSAWEITGAIKRDAASNTALVGSVTSTLIAQDAAASAWAITVTADDTAEALAIKVTGAAATTIRWNVRGDISELRF